jgi:hypothetical protein
LPLQITSDSDVDRDNVKKVAASEMMFVSRKIFGRYFNIDDEAVDRLVDHFYGHLSAMDSERNRACQSVLEWKRNW